MKYWFKHFILFISTITNICVCANSIQSVYNKNQDIINRYPTLGYFVPNSNTIGKHNFDYYQEIYDKLIFDISKFRIDTKNSMYTTNESNDIKSMFFNTLHSMKNELQKLVISSEDIKEQNKINTYININLKSRNIYLILN